MSLSVTTDPRGGFDWDAAKIVLVFAAVSLNGLTKLSPVLYAPLLGLALLVLLVDLFRRPFRFATDSLAGAGLLLAYLGFTYVSLVHSTGNLSATGAIIGLGRFLFAIPVLLAFLLYVRDARTLRHALIGIAIVVAVGNLSIPWQMAFGEIEWLGSDYKRGGFDRFASLLGNVTAIGISAGFYFAIILILMRPGLWKTLLCLAIVVSAIASLSKAAIFNLAIPVLAVVGLGLFARFRVFKKLPIRAMAGFSVLVVVVVGVAMLVPAVRGRVLVSLASFGVSSQETVLVDDVSVGTSFQERLLQHPTKVFQNLDLLQGPTGLLTGAGFGMSATALVPEADALSIMAHNQLVEFWALGGVFFLVTFLLFLVMVGWRLWDLCARSWLQGIHAQRILYVALAVVFACFLANLPFANGLVYQPTQATIFWLFFALLVLPRDVLLADAQVPASSLSTT